uniref:Putative secreted protein n=1 Tax=Anopheles triannulatus TaxID=58253 RepID=A0A2M4B1P7_9DIPT
MVHHLALGIQTALFGVARAATLAPDARQLRAAVLVLAALVRFPAAGRSVRITDRPVRALAAIGTGNVLTNGRLVAGCLGALVDIRTPERCPDETLHTPALASLADALRWTVPIGGTSRDADTGLTAHLAGKTVVVGVANLGADTGVASFTDGTSRSTATGRRRLRASEGTLVGDAGVTNGTLLRRLTVTRHTHTALLRYWITLETGRTRAPRYMVGALAKGIRPTGRTGRLARIHTLEVDARLRSAAILAASASDRTDPTGNAGLPLTALAVVGARHRTDTVDAAFTSRAVLAVPASHQTLATMADVSVAVEIA